MGTRHPPRIAASATTRVIGSPRHPCALAYPTRTFICMVSKGGFGYFDDNSGPSGLASLVASTRNDIRRIRSLNGLMRNQ